MYNTYNILSTITTHVFTIMSCTTVNNKICHNLTTEQMHKIHNLQSQQYLQTYGSRKRKPQIPADVYYSNIFYNIISIYLKKHKWHIRAQMIHFHKNVGMYELGNKELKT